MQNGTGVHRRNHPAATKNEDNVERVSPPLAKNVDDGTSLSVSGTVFFPFDSGRTRFDCWQSERSARSCAIRGGSNIVYSRTAGREARSAEGRIFFYNILEESGKMCGGLEASAHTFVF